jgi:hypothetical protein
MGTPLASWLSNMFIEPLTSGGGDPVRNDILANQLARRRGATVNGSSMSLKFQNAYGACNFIVTWDGENANELLEAIQYAREHGDRFIQDKLIEYILNIPFRNPRPDDIPAFVGRPVWAVDKHGQALVGMPGAETIEDANSLRGLSHPAKELAGDT